MGKVGEKCKMVHTNKTLERDLIGPYVLNGVPNTFSWAVKVYLEIADRGKSYILG